MRGGADQYTAESFPRPTPRLIVLGVPTLGLVHMRWRYAMQMLKQPMNTRVHEYSVWGLSTADARNVIVARALKLEASHVFFVDDDTLIPPDALIDLLARDRPIVSGLYYAKTAAPQPLVLHGRFEGTAKGWQPGDLVECYGHGMGCTLIRTEVFADLAARGAIEQTTAPCSACNGEGCAGCQQTGKALRWFYTTDSVVTGPDGHPVRTHQTEDVYFLERAKTAGYQPAVDTGIFCWHHDTQTDKVYPLKQWEEFSRAGTVTWETATGPVTWKGVSPR